jgi:hypothetical protein
MIGDGSQKIGTKAIPAGGADRFGEAGEALRTPGVPARGEDDWRRTGAGDGRGSIHRDAPDFHLAEFTRNPEGVANAPGPGEIRALERLSVEVLQPVRDVFGPLQVLRGFVGTELAARLSEGGFHPAHLDGRAAVVAATFATGREIATWLWDHEGAPVGDVIWRPDDVALYVEWAPKESGKGRRFFRLERRGDRWTRVSWTPTERDRVDLRARIEGRANEARYGVVEESGDVGGKVAGVAFALALVGAGFTARRRRRKPTSR